MNEIVCQQCGGFIPIAEAVAHKRDCLAKIAERVRSLSPGQVVILNECEVGTVIAILPFGIEVMRDDGFSTIYHPFRVSSETFVRIA